MGKWFKQPRKPIDNHVHEHPDYVPNDEDVRAGDRYQCSCGKVFEIIRVQGVYAYGKDNGIQAVDWKRVHAPGVMQDTRLPRMPEHEREI